MAGIVVSEPFKILVFNPVAPVYRMSTPVYSCRQEVDPVWLRKIAVASITCRWIKSITYSKKCKKVSLKIKKKYKNVTWSYCQYVIVLQMIKV